MPLDCFRVVTPLRFGRGVTWRMERGNGHERGPAGEGVGRGGGLLGRRSQPVAFTARNLHAHHPQHHHHHRPQQQQDCD